MRYDEFTDADRYRMVKQRLKQYEAKHFEAELNLEAARAAGRTQDVDRIQETIREFAAAISQTRATLAKLPKPPVEPAENSPPEHVTRKRVTRRS